MRKVGKPDIYRVDNQDEHYLVIVDNMVSPVVLRVARWPGISCYILVLVGAAGQFLCHQRVSPVIAYQPPDIVVQMNLDLLYQATELTGDNRYADIATTQAERMIQGFIRPDGTTYHVVDYGKDGSSMNGMTHQGELEASSCTVEVG